MFVFENCLLNDNLSALIISGFPTVQQLSTSWNNILGEYTEALGTSEYILYVNKYREVEVQKLNIEMIKIAIKYLRKNYSQYFADELRAMLRINCKFNVKDVDSYFAELDKCERRIGGLTLNLNLREIELEEIKKAFDGDKKSMKKIDKNYFSAMLIIIGRNLNLGYRLTKDIMVNEYCEYFRQCADESERARKESNKYSR